MNYLFILTPLGQVYSAREPKTVCTNDLKTKIAGFEEQDKDIRKPVSSPYNPAHQLM